MITPISALTGAVLLLASLASTGYAAPPRVAPTLSTAGSLTYEYRNNVWIARPDGSHAHAVTKDGTSASPYQQPTQADNGTIEAM
jgi:hypothetical protein